jgi:hypothetical protein
MEENIIVQTVFGRLTFTQEEFEAARIDASDTRTDIINRLVCSRLDMVVTWVRVWK